MDWIISTGANLYHDAHFALGLAMHRGTPQADDVELREEGRGAHLRHLLRLQRAALHRRVLPRGLRPARVPAPDEHAPSSTTCCGKYVREREKALGLTPALGARGRARAGRADLHRSPGDSSIGMNVAAQALEGNKLRFDVSADVNETAAIVLEAKRSGGKSGVLILGRRQPQELHAPDRAADPGGARHRREGPRLLPADHRRPPRHRRPLRRDAGRGGELGQDRSRPAARHRGRATSTTRSRCRSSPPMPRRGTPPGRSSASTAAARP